MIHCWASGPDGSSSCMEPDGHEGPHVYVPDDQIRVEFTTPDDTPWEDDRVDPDGVDIGGPW